jgi:putative phosphoribosyl transferase
VRRREEAELRRRAAALRGVRPPPPLTGLVVLVDDGLATGATMFAAVTAVRAAQRSAEPAAAGVLVVAVPVGSGDTCRQLLQEVDDVICLWLPLPFGAVSEAYRDFTQTSDEEVIALLGRARG